MDKNQYFFERVIKSFKLKSFMKYIAYCLEHFMDHTNMPHFHQLILDNKISPEKNIFWEPCIYKYINKTKNNNLNFH